MEFIDYEKFRAESGIYMITCTSNGKQYIGKTEQRFSKRFWHHQWQLRKNCHDNKYLQNAWNKYGETAFTFSVVHALKPDDDINALEKYYISLYNTYEDGFNLTKGGEGMSGFTMPDSIKKYVGEVNRKRLLGTKLSDETREKMRKSSRHLSPSADTIQKVKDYMSNRVVSEETREKLRVLNTGSHSPVTKLTEFDVECIKKRFNQWSFTTDTC